MVLFGHLSWMLDYLKVYQMSKVDDLLRSCKENLGNWTCAYCASNSGQPAAIFREIKKLGYKFEETTPGRWAKEMECPVCGMRRTHYKLLSEEPAFQKKQRINIDSKNRIRILKLLEGTDAFSGASITSTPEIDHKTPWTRLLEDVDSSKLSDSEVKEHFQLLTREHNLLKDRMCGFCKLNGIRPPFLGIRYWYEGDEHYADTCVGCGWYDGIKWKEEVNKLIEQL